MQIRTYLYLSDAFICNLTEFLFEYNIKLDSLFFNILFFFVEQVLTTLCY